MSVLKNKEGNELLLDCNCGCDNGIRFRIDKDDHEWYCCMSYTNGNWYRDSCQTFFHVLRKKLRKIWAIIRSKDYHYSELMLTKEEFETFCEYINEV